MFGNKLPKRGMVSLRGVNDNIAIEEHYCPRAGNARS
jgi:hypothetical protein